MKDLFSSNSQDYAKFRPSYPDALFHFIFENVNCFEAAWDCGTGNGQVAAILAEQFTTVRGTDISQNQLDQATMRTNIIYSLQPAEKTDLESQHFDLITVAQAIHWFDFEAFYMEAKRILKPSGIIAVIGYGECTIDTEVDAIMHAFHDGLLGMYWDKERHYVDEGYHTIPFPFHEIEAPVFQKNYEWDLERFLGYVSTWSALRHFKTAMGYDPMDDLRKELSISWPGDEKKSVCFPTLLRMGKLDPL